jgi:adenylate kinase
MQHVVIMLGAPGAGKGTQAQRLSEALSLPHVSTGDLFRENLSQGTELGAKAKVFMERGDLVPDELVIDMLFDRVSRDDCGGGYLLDGFPRTIGQAESLERRLGSPSSGQEANVTVVDIQVPDAIITERITGRWSCPDCGSVFHASFSPPKAAGTCDSCGGTLTQRKDDTAEVVVQRLANYHELTAPLASWYQERGVYCAVDGDTDPDSVFEACLACIQQEAKR